MDHLLTEGCAIDVKSLGLKHPLIIDPTDLEKFIYPDKNGKINLNIGNSVFASCTLDNLLTINGKLLYQSASEATCVGQNKFISSIWGDLYNYPDLQCLQITEHCMRRQVSEDPFGMDLFEVSTSKPSKDERYQYFAIGFKVDTHNFLPVIQGWTDPNAMSTLWVRSIVPYKQGGRQSRLKTTGLIFDRTGCCNDERVNLNGAYGYSNQKASFRRNFQCAADETCTYVVEKMHYFNRGHLTPQEYFIYQAERRLTFAYLNVVPQWNTINAENWKAIETYVRTLATQKKADLDVFTGVYDSLHLIDTPPKSEPVTCQHSLLKIVELIVWNRQQLVTTARLKVPKYFWKIIVNRETKRSIAIVCVNDRHIEKTFEKLNDDTYPAFHLCRNPKFREPSWQLPRSWDPKNVAKGYSYVCPASEFLDNVPRLPQIVELRSLVNGNKIMYNAQGKS